MRQIMQREGCPFCRPAAERIFHVGEQILGIWDAYPVSPGHALLIPKRHVERWFDASREELAELTDAVRFAGDTIQRRYSPDGFNIGSNVGTAAGQTVPHLHLHVIPRYAGDVPDPRGGIRGVIPERARYDPAGEDSAEIREQSPSWSSSSARPSPITGSEANGDATTVMPLSGVAFGEKLLQLLDEGQFTAMYKFAVLLGLTELCLERHTIPSARLALTTRALSEKVIDLYWTQTAPFVGPTAPKTLLQNRRGQAEIVTAICSFRKQSKGDPGEKLWRARTRAPERYEQLARRVEWKLIEMPLPRLQVVGTTERRGVPRI